MQRTNVARAWGRILQGRTPSLSIEITRECPLQCPGCYAYEPDHLQQPGGLRSVADFKGQELIERVLALVLEHRPLHISIVGGEPLVRFRELDALLPQLSELGLNIQLVTSALREIPIAWSRIKNLSIVVSIDGLQPEHDARRKPATYDRILKNIEGQSITVHCTVTSQMTNREDYFSEFLSFWSARPEVNRIWFSLFTPQIGAHDEEILSREERAAVAHTLAGLRPRFPKLYLPDPMIRGFLTPPSSPKECVFALTTANYTADLRSRILPCQFGGNPDCSNCGCVASAGLNAIGDYKLLGLLPIRRVLYLSAGFGKASSRLRAHLSRGEAGASR
jgi:sulfatase maturation enzyme AslB (radical SAM superfamily)